MHWLISCSAVVSASHPAKVVLLFQWKYRNRKHCDYYWFWIRYLNLGFSRGSLCWWTFQGIAAVMVHGEHCSLCYVILFFCFLILKSEVNIYLSADNVHKDQRYYMIQTLTNQYHQINTRQAKAALLVPVYSCHSKLKTEDWMLDLSSCVVCCCMFIHLRSLTEQQNRVCLLEWTISAPTALHFHFTFRGVYTCSIFKINRFFPPWQILYCKMQNSNVVQQLFIPQPVSSCCQH